MKPFEKFICTLSFALLWGYHATTFAQDADTTIHFRNYNYRLKEHADGEINVKVYNPDGTENKMIYEGTYMDGRESRRWELNATFSFPFEEYVGGRKKSKRNHRFNPHWAGVGLGFCNAFNTRTPGFDVKFSESFEVAWNILDWGYAPVGSRVGLVFGIGMTWRNYELHNGYYFHKSSNSIQIIQAEPSREVDFSRMKTVDLVFPILMQWDFLSTYLQVGAQVNLRTHSSLRTRYDLDGDSHRYYRDGIGSMPINLDLVARFGLGCYLSLYAKYSPHSMFESGSGPRMNVFSTGIMLNY